MLDIFDGRQCVLVPCVANGLTGGSVETLALDVYHEDLSTAGKSPAVVGTAIVTFLSSDSLSS